MKYSLLVLSPAFLIFAHQTECIKTAGYSVAVNPVEKMGALDVNLPPEDSDGFTCITNTGDNGLIVTLEKSSSPVRLLGGQLGRK